MNQTNGLRLARQHRWFHPDVKLGQHLAVTTTTFENTKKRPIFELLLFVFVAFCAQSHRSQIRTSKAAFTRNGEKESDVTRPSNRSKWRFLEGILKTKPGRGVAPYGSRLAPGDSGIVGLFFGDSFSGGRFSTSVGSLPVRMAFRSRPTTSTSFGWRNVRVGSPESGCGMRSIFHSRSGHHAQA